MSEERSMAAGIARRAGLLVASTVAGLLLAEGAVRLLGYSALYDVYSKPSLFWQHDDLLGWSHAPGSRGHFVGPRPFPIEFRAPVEINSLGLRGPEIEPLPADGLRVLLLGDSGLASFEVAHEQSFVAIVERRLTNRLERPVQVINAGVRGYGTDQTYLYFRERGRLLEADLVIHFHNSNDASDNMTLPRMRRPFGKGAFALAPDGSLALVGFPIPRYPLCSAWRMDGRFRPGRRDGAGTRALCWMQTRLADQSALFSLATRILQLQPDLMRKLYELGDASAGLLLPASAHAREQESRFRPAASLTTALLRELAREVDASGARFVVVLRKSDRERLDAAYLAGAPIDFVTGDPLEMDPAFVPRGQRTTWRNDRHLTPFGHEIRAMAVLPAAERHLRAILQARSDGAG